MILEDQPNPEAAFSNGLMAGYNVVDAIRQRHIEAQNRADQIELQNKQFGLEQSNADQENARGNAQLALQQHASDQRDALAADDALRQQTGDFAHGVAAAALAANGAANIPPDQKALIIAGQRKLDPDGMKGLSDNDVFSHALMTTNSFDQNFGVNEARTRQAASDSNAIYSLLSGASQDAAQGQQPQPGAPTPTNPTPRQDQAAAPAQTVAPSPVGTADAGAQSASPLASLVNPNNPISLGGPIGQWAAPAGAAAAARINAPLSDAVKARSADLDTAESAEPSSPGYVGKVQAAQAALVAAQQAYQGAAGPEARGQAADVSQAAGEATARQAVDAAVPRGTIPVGPRAGAAMHDALAAHAAGNNGLTPTATTDDLQRSLVQAQRLSDKRTSVVSAHQLKMVAHLAQTGVISFDAANNFATTGHFAKPSRPNVYDMGNGYALMVGDGGTSLVSVPTAGKSTTDADKLQTQENTAHINDYIKATYGKDAAQRTNQFYEWLGKSKNAELGQGVPLVDPKTGAIQIGAMDPDELSQSLDGFGAFVKGEVAPGLFHFRQKQAPASYAPGQPNYPASALAPSQGGAGGWSITPVQ